MKRIEYAVARRPALRWYNDLIGDLVLLHTYHCTTRCWDIGSIRLLFETLLRRIAEDQGRVAGDDAA